MDARYSFETRTEDMLALILARLEDITEEIRIIKEDIRSLREDLRSLTEEVRGNHRELLGTQGVIRKAGRVLVQV
jgi:predicted  nucleic acid-binding Zn-ribbon protein